MRRRKEIESVSLPSRSNTDQDRVKLPSFLKIKEEKQGCNIKIPLKTFQFPKIHRFE